MCLVGLKTAILPALAVMHFCCVLAELGHVVKWAGKHVVTSLRWGSITGQLTEAITEPMLSPHVNLEPAEAIRSSMMHLS